MKKFIASLLLGCTLATGAAFAAYPEKSVRITVPYPSGQTTDVIARLLAEQFSKELGQPFVVENKGGAGGIIGVEAAKRDKPDGYNLLIAASGPLGINPSLYTNLPYDPAKDFTAVGMVSMVPLFLVTRSDFPANTVPELIEYIKKNPGKINYGSGGIGLTNHLTMEMFKQATDLSLLHVPYRGATAAVAGLVGGDTSVMFEAAPAIKPLVQDGRLKVFAVANKSGAQAFEGVQPLDKLGVPDFDATAWIALIAPTGTPDEAIQTLNKTMNKILQDPELKAKLATIGNEVFIASPQESQTFIEKEIENWGKAAKAAGVEPAKL